MIRSDQKVATHAHVESDLLTQRVDDLSGVQVIVVTGVRVHVVRTGAELLGIPRAAGQDADQPAGSRPAASRCATA